MASVSAAADTRADRVQNLGSEDLRNFNPITGFIDAPVLTLSDAIAVAVSSMAEEQVDPMLDTRVELACDFADGLLGDCEDSGEVELLERDEIAAIHLYTQDTKFYVHLNDLLRSRSREPLKSFAPYLRLFLGALHKLPRVKGMVYRGIKENVSAKYKTGSKFVWWAVSNTTSSIDALSSDSYFGNSGQRTFFTIDAQHAIDIARYSSVPNKNELVLVPGARMRVIACLPSGPGLCIVQCQEIGQPLGFFDYPVAAEAEAASSVVSIQSVPVASGASQPSMPPPQPSLPVPAPLPPPAPPALPEAAIPIMNQSAAPNAASSLPPVPLPHSVVSAVAAVAPLPSHAAPVLPNHAAPVPPLPPAHASATIDIARTLVEGRLMTEKCARPGDRVNLRLQLCDAAGLFVLQSGHRWRVLVQSRDFDTDENVETLAAQQNVLVQDTGMGTYKVSFNAVAGPRRLLIVSDTTGLCIPHLDFEVGSAPPPPAVVHTAPTVLFNNMGQPMMQAHVQVPFPPQPQLHSQQSQPPPQVHLPSAKKQHAGQFRSHEVCKQHGHFCNRDEAHGVLCKHGNTTITRHHWSCCGSPDALSRLCPPPGGFKHTHTGVWRDQDVTVAPCSLPADPDGPLCAHHNGRRLIESSHWSCCGGTNRTSEACVPSPPAGHTHPGEYRDVEDGSLRRYCSDPRDPEGEPCLHGCETLRVSHWSCCGERFRMATACCPPGGANNRHAGQWKVAAANGRSVCGDNGVCAHRPDPDMVVSHWSCCGDINRANETCIDHPTHAHTHPGDWRVVSPKLWVKYCSRPPLIEGRVCAHGPAQIKADHWTWYV